MGPHEDNLIITIGFPEFLIDHFMLINVKTKVSVILKNYVHQINTDTQKWIRTYVWMSAGWMQVQPAGNSKDTLVPAVEQDRHSGSWALASPCCHDDGLPPKPCISIISPWSEPERARVRRQRKSSETKWMCYTLCYSAYVLCLPYYDIGPSAQP